MAFSRSPSASLRAALHSMTPMPVRLTELFDHFRGDLHGVLLIPPVRVCFFRPGLPPPAPSAASGLRLLLLLELLA